MENIALAEPGAHLSIWALFLQAGWVVKLVMIGLLCASIWTWAIIVDKLVAYGRMRLALNRFEQVFWSGQSLEELYRTLADRKTAGMGAIFVAAMREWKKSFEKGAKSPLGLQTRIDKAMDLALTREMERLEGQARLPRHHRLGGAVHRPVRHRGRHHDLVPGDRRHPRIDQPGGRRTRHRRGAAGHGDRPARGHPRRHRLQQAVVGRGQDRRAHGRVRGRVLRHTLAPNR